MQAVILAGGKGTRLSEETQGRPKPLVEAGGQPLLWHIMQNYARFGVTDFVVLVGYKGQQIREYFANYWLHQSDITFDLAAPNLKIHEIRSLPWKVTVVDTGLETQTGGRISRIKELISEDEVKKILIENAFWKFIEKTIEIDSCFPKDYYINGIKDYKSSSKSDFLRWWLDNAFGENSDKIITEKFEEISNRLKLDIKL